MTVAELIRILETHPPDLRVMADGYEGGVDDLKATLVFAKDVRLNVNKAWYYGRHEEMFEGDELGGYEVVHALILRRPWHDGEL